MSLAEPPPRSKHLGGLRHTLDPPAPGAGVGGSQVEAEIRLITLRMQEVTVAKITAVKMDGQTVLVQECPRCHRRSAVDLVENRSNV